MGRGVRVFLAGKVREMTLDEFVREVWEPGSGRLRECTRAGYASAYRLHIAPALGGMGLGEVTPAVLDGWLAGFASAGAARKSWALLRSILRLAVRRGYLEADPTIRVERVPGRGENGTFHSIDAMRDMESQPMVTPSGIRTQCWTGTSESFMEILSCVVMLPSAFQTHLVI